ncbi:MarR family winged helix-turn-helix transcriptional regulator [Pseudomonas entomophila]|uniref:MarR family winged helix-turn-helix transcriptional regulator n=1 Tax=Pseudomonas entomophila TaxID=312306 RepID=UPI0023D7F02A|nr:MarR family winged helix-turn-helix transcriptional regulator [Pseudomonas entomophila]MDF0729291.1 MarR family winged helix-turn-helix transcriptional regulator [Pseudomonas entomophila]
MTDTTLFDLLERLSSLTRAWFRQHPLLAELQPIQLSALMYLARCNHYSNTPLGVTDYLGLTKGTVSQSLKALEAKGLVVKTQDAHDRRSVHLQLTDSARALLDAVLPPDFLATGQARMGERGAQLQALLGDLLGEVQRGTDVPGFGLCASCRFHQRVDGLPFCGLTRQALAPPDAALICREHQPPEPA